MTTGEKIALFRKKKGITQEELSDLLNVSRQSVSRWEMDATFPETDKLIRLSKLFACSIDFLLNDDMYEEEQETKTSADDCCRFIRDCGYFFLATSVDHQPRLRPFGMIYSDEKDLYFATDQRKSVYADLTHNPKIEVAAYNLHTRRWIRIRGRAEPEKSGLIREGMIDTYPMLRQKYRDEAEIYLVIYKILIEDVSIA